MKKFILKNSYVFTWLVADMSGIFPIIITHALNVNPEARLVRQKKRKSTTNQIQVVREETEKPLKVGFIKEVQYSD